MIDFEGYYMVSTGQIGGAGREAYLEVRDAEAEREARHRQG